eukprot:g1190.t1 g1190   contig10:1571378-1572496(+)
MPPIDDSLDALEALLQFREQVCSKMSSSRSNIHHEIPVPNPLNPSLPHLIEGDAPTSARRRSVGRFSLKRIKRTFVPKPDTSVEAAVPNPLAPIADSSSDESCSSLMPTSSSTVSYPIVDTTSPIVHGFDISSNPAPSGCQNTNSVTPLVRTDMIQDALNSKSQRGKKRCNLNDVERLELTRTRNREHAKCTRMKKKARHEELVAMEQRYRQLKQQQDLNLQRRTRVFNLIDSIGDISTSRSCPHRLQLEQLATEKLQNAQFSVGPSSPISVALTTEDSAMVKISVNGTAYKSGEAIALSGIVSVDFKFNSADISLFRFTGLSQLPPHLR